MEIKEEKAKQGTRGRHTFVILCASLFLIIGGYLIIGIIADAPDEDTTPAISTTN